MWFESLLTDTTQCDMFKCYKYHFLNFAFALGTIGPPVTVPNGNLVQSDAEENRSDTEPLPPGWEMRFDTYGRRYYVDHNTK